MWLKKFFSDGKNSTISMPSLVAIAGRTPSLGRKFEFRLFACHAPQQQVMNGRMIQRQCRPLKVDFDAVFSILI